MPQDFQIHQPDDRFFKSAMSDPEVAKAYLLHFYPEISEIADFESLSLESSLSVRPSLKQFETDVVYRCRFKGEANAYFYFCLVFEHKSEPDKYIAVQIGFYIMELMFRMVKERGQNLEPVLPLIFYNGKKEWVPKRLPELFIEHPYFNIVKPYIPDFRFLYQDASRLAPEELVHLDLSYFRSVIMAMAFRYRQHLIFRYIEPIFEGALGKEKITAITTYILGVGERSEESFLQELNNTAFSIKPEVMSTLEQILERGRKEGLEKGLEKGLDKGIYKNRIFNLLKTTIRFPKMTGEELSDFTELDLPVVTTFLSVKSQKDAAALKKHILEDLLADIPVSNAEKGKLTNLIEQLS
jgi:predicted transposase/invertase (TIGR01784 family)